VASLAPTRATACHTSIQTVHWNALGSPLRSVIRTIDIIVPRPLPPYPHACILSLVVRYSFQFPRVMHACSHPCIHPSSRLRHTPDDGSTHGSRTRNRKSRLTCHFFLYLHPVPSLIPRSLAHPASPAWRGPLWRGAVRSPRTLRHPMFTRLENVNVREICITSPSLGYLRARSTAE
jgi:hypothetical protein